MTPASLCLAIESATPVASVALLRGERVLAEEQGPSGQHHSENLLPMVDRALTASGLSLSDLDFFAISIGPGAFTSLRIGLATLKGLAFGRDQLVVPVSTLQALALTGMRAGRLESSLPVVPVLDARRGEVYAAAYDRDELARAEAVERLPSSVYSADDLMSALPDGGQLIGGGAEVVLSAGLSASAAHFSRETAGVTVPDAVSVGLLGQASMAVGQGVAVDSLVPRYVRRAEAEALRISRPLE